jgi:fatty acid kinase fatty acid binding subunit
VARVAIVTDSAADLVPEVAASAAITVVPLAVTFGAESFRAGVDLSTDAFWERMLAPSAPFPTTAAASPGDFKDAFEARLAEGADAVVCIAISGRLSGTLKSATIARDMLPDREIHVIDSRTASMGHGLLALMAAGMAAEGRTGREIAAEVEARIPAVDLFVALDTLEYMRRGGRLSATQAAIGSLLSVKPIVTVRDGLVEPLERVRTRSKARERVLELLTERPAERVAILYTPPADHESFRQDVIARVAGGISPEHVSVQPVGPSVGPHLGPGCLGGVVLLRR